MDQHRQEKLQTTGPDKKNQVVERSQHIPGVSCTAPIQRFASRGSAELNVETAPGGKRSEQGNTTDEDAHDTGYIECPDEISGSEMLPGKCHGANQQNDAKQKQAAFHDITFHTDIQDLNMKVHADPSQMQQVFLNLVINARDAMDGAGPIDIRLRGIPNKHSVVIEIEDKGCGISKERLRTSFEPFYTTKTEHGNGLGLAVVSSIVEEHGGHISVKSTLGEWTVFKVSMPAVSPEEDVKRSISTAPAYHDWSED